MNLDGLIVADSELGIKDANVRSVYALVGQTRSLYGDECYGSLLLNVPARDISLQKTWASCAVYLNSKTCYPARFERELVSRPAYLGDFSAEYGVEDLWCLHKKSPALGIGIPFGTTPYALYHGPRAALYAMEHFKPSTYRLFFGMGLMPKDSIDESVFHQYYYAVKPHRDILFNPPTASSQEIWEKTVAQITPHERVSVKSFVPWWPERVVFSPAQAAWENHITPPLVH